MLESRRREEGRLVVQQLGETGADGEGTPGSVVLVEVIERVESSGGDEAAMDALLEAGVATRRTR